MKSSAQYLISVVLGVVCLVLSVSAIVSGKANTRLQQELQAQQIEINKGMQSQQVATNLLRDIGPAATKNSKLKDLLTRNGFTLTEDAPSSQNR
jgi:predicted Holliday junction resolvase-like endonuclease